jgi:hypothetical protein
MSLTFFSLRFLDKGMSPNAAVSRVKQAGIGDALANCPGINTAALFG